MKRRVPHPPPSAPSFFSTDVAEARRFYLEFKPSTSRPLVVVCGGRELSAADYAIRRETFPFFSIEYVARGAGTVTLAGRSAPLRPGRVFSYGPGVSQQITGQPGEPLVKYFVDFTGSGARRLLRSCGLAPGRVSDVYPASALRPLFDELIDAGLQARPQTPALCARLLECLALRIASARAPAQGTDSPAFDTYEACRRHIEAHALRLHSLRQIADECHVEAAYVCRLFRRYDHESPFQCLRRLKMAFAAERLRQPGVLVKQVAEEAGFPDAFHFSRVFRAAFGVSPAAFRRLR